MSVSRILGLVLVTSVVLLGAGCGGDDSGDGSTAPTTVETQATEPAPGTASVDMDEFSFEPEDVVVKRGDTIEVANGGKVVHNLTVEQGPDPKEKTDKLAGTATFGPDESENLEIDLEPGEYAMVCTVAGHREQGMIGTFTVE